MSSPSAFAELLKALPKQTLATLQEVEDRLRQRADEYGEPLTTYAKETLLVGGKRLRPLLVFLAADAENAQSKQLLYSATAVELLHTATLVHDDILDQAPLRRGKPTVFATAGIEMATATGDFLFAQAFRELLLTHNAKAVQALTQASQQLVLGELLQRQDAYNTELQSEQYFQRCKQKTASLFVACVKLGVYASKDYMGKEHEDSLTIFAENLGLAFQIFDDILDITGSTNQLGKQRGTDLVDGTITLPLIFALQAEPKLHAALKNPKKTAVQATVLCDEIQNTNAISQAKQTAYQLVDEAKNAITSLPAQQRELLILAATSAVRRYQ